MQLIEIGRNDPCLCGSGRKYKKCCSGAQDAVTADPRALDVAALVDRAIEDDDWEPVHDVFDPSLELFEPMRPLEHVRFRDDLITPNAVDSSLLGRLCGGGWLRWCEREICYVLERQKLDEGEQDGLRLAIHMLRRFGAKSPVVDSVAEIQNAERGARVRAWGDTVSRLGFTLKDLEPYGDDLFDWFVRAQPAVLPFSDWFALRAAPDEAQAEALWLERIAPRVCTICLSRANQPDAADAFRWLQLAMVAIVGRTPYIGEDLAQVTPPRTRTDDERMVYTAITSGEESDRLPGSLSRIGAAAEARGDFAGAAVLRDTQQSVKFRTLVQRRFR